MEATINNGVHADTNILAGRRGLVVVAGLTALGTALRVFQLGAQSLWLDEVFSVFLARRDWAGIIAGTAQDTMPPLYYFLLHISLQFRMDETAARAVSVLFSCATIPIFYLLARDLFDRRVAVLATVMFAISPFQIIFAQEARMYAALTFWSAMALFFFQRTWRAGRSLDWALFVVAETLAFYTHSLAFLNLLALDVFVLLRRGEWKSKWSALGVAHAAMALLYAPWLVFFLQQVLRVQAGFWGAPPSVLNLIATPYLFLLGNTAPVALVPVALFAGLGLVSFALLAIRKAPATQSFGLFLAVSVLAVPLVVLYLVSQVRPLYVERTLIPASLGLYLLLAWTIASAPPRIPNVILGSLLLLVMAISLPNYYFNPEMHKPPMREAARKLAAQVRPGDRIAHTSDSSALAFAYYEPELANGFLAGDPDYVQETTRGRTGRISGLVPEERNALVAGGSRVWLVVALDHNVEYQKSRVREFDSLYRQADRQDVGGIDLLLYQVRP